MKRLMLIPVVLLLLASCNTGRNSEPADSTDTCISFPEPEEGVFDFSDNIYSTDWMHKYVQYIESHFKGRGDMWFEKTEDNPFDCKYWTMAYVDADTIPELLLYGGCWASGTIILTQHNGEVYPSPRGAFSYIQGDGFLHSLRHHGDNFWGEVYEMKEGRFVELCNYSFSTDIYDTNRIGEFGLKRADLDAQYAGGFADSAVGITFITMNDDTIGARFGYNNAFCPGAAQVNKMVDEQYYSKGKCTYFPFPSEKMEISTLLNISK